MMSTLLCSKWLKLQVLLDSSELQQLFESLGESYLVQTGKVLSTEENAEVSFHEFFKTYHRVIVDLQQGRIPDEQLYRHLFSSVITSSKDILSTVSLAPGKQMVRYRSPVIQMQSLRLGYSSEENLIRPMVFGPDTIWWGIQFSYPQICVDSQTETLLDLSDTAAYPNTALFKKMQKAVRQLSVPTPFLLRGEVQHHAVRLGYRCFEWINAHPQLKSLGISINTGSSYEQG